MKQTSIEVPIIAPGEAHMPCVLLLDTSGSMEGMPIDNLNQALNRFKQQTCLDPLAQKRVEVCIIEFNDAAKVVMEFTPVSMMQPVTLKAGGLTAMGAGISLAIDKLKERLRSYSQMGTPCYKPWIFMITDGEPYGEEKSAFKDACKRIKDEEAKGRLKFFALGVDGFNRDVLLDICSHQTPPRVMELLNHDFSQMFDWITKSMATISQSVVGTNVQLAPLPANAQKVDPKRDTTGF